MKIRKVNAVFFSPAGSTAAVTQRIASHIASALEVSCENIDFTLPASREAHGHYNFASDELVVFGTPTYAGRIPNKALPFVQEMFDGSGTPAVAVVTYGNRNCDSSLTELVRELGAHGFRVMAASAWVCRHVFSSQIAAGRPDVSDQRKMDAFASGTADRLKAAFSEASDGNTPDLKVPVVRSGEPVAPYYIPKGEDGQPAKFLKAKPLTDLSKCTSCGICAKVCPMGSVSTENFADVPGICIKCQACVLQCPEGAKYFDDAAFLSHVRMLEKNFTARREPEWYWG